MAFRRTVVSKLPHSLQRFIEKYPDLWKAYESLGKASASVGPLGEKYVQLIKVAVAGSKKQETSFKTHVRQALRAGATEAEVEHAVIQLLTSEGMGGMMTAMKWAEEILHEERRRKK